ncbi:hypothetical protein HL273_20335 [Yersinia enterocolitica]|uniref:hypothetical protein n=1 Tax=Yersinia enterocolitica TaxID=630 RepID=UPI00155AD38B|nr:hypothetical protein [Yersinia enterocolitica]MBX9483890.1 hypothetical protein [Yersinia enterocolitica]NQS96546.1 hypothetical protein [Yersinia enterocolitica]NQT45619.1 hypothetical protein [Yersinia enterocolitica]NQU02354.1 hypothetical protein [Yersinia enterocolitica]HDM8447469.1 hypothetical protein [Yersinia enterocolitica]
MSNVIKSVWSGAADSILSPVKAVKSAVKGDFSQAWKDLKHIPGNQERANSKTLNSLGVRGWVGDHPGETAAGIVASIFGGTALMGGGGASASSGAPISAAVGTPATGGAGAGGSVATSGSGGVMSSLFSNGNFGNALSAGGSLLNAFGSVSSGNASSSMSLQEAAQLDSQATTTRAQSQIQAREDRRQARLAESRAQALAAASGANANSTSFVNNISDMESQGELNALTSLWSGNQQANVMKSMANAKRMEASSAKKAGGIGALSSVLSAGKSLYSMFGG